MTGIEVPSVKFEEGVWKVAFLVTDADWDRVRYDLAQTTPAGRRNNTLSVVLFWVVLFSTAAIVFTLGSQFGSTGRNLLWPIVGSTAPVVYMLLQFVVAGLAAWLVLSLIEGRLNPRGPAHSVQYLEFGSGAQLTHNDGNRLRTQPILGVSRNEDMIFISLPGGTFAFIPREVVGDAAFEQMFLLLNYGVRRPPSGRMH